MIRPRRSAGNSSVAMVIATASSLTRNIRARNWMAVNVATLWAAAVNPVKRAYRRVVVISRGRRPARSPMAMTNSANRAPRLTIEIGLPSRSLDTWKSRARSGMTTAAIPVS